MNKIRDLATAAVQLAAHANKATIESLGHHPDLAYPDVEERGEQETAWEAWSRQLSVKIDRVRELAEPFISPGLSFEDAIARCAVRSAIRRQSKPDRKWWKNHQIPLGLRVPLVDQLADGPGRSTDRALYPAGAGVPEQHAGYAFGH